MFLRKFSEKNVAEFSGRSIHFPYTTLKMFKEALNNYTMLTLCLF